MAAFLQSKLPKALAAKGESNHEVVMRSLPIEKESQVAVIFVRTASLH